MGRGGIPPLPTGQNQPAATNPDLEGSWQPLGPLSTSPTTDLHPFSLAAETHSLHSSHTPQAPSQPASHLCFSVCSGSPTFAFSLEEGKNKLMKQHSMQDALPLSAWLLL